MADRLRALLDRPLDPSAARAILVFASAILVGIAGLFVLAASEQDRQSSTAERPASIASPQALPTEAKGGEQSEPRSPTRRQDPQDVKGSTAARRAARALRSHRALQHVPYRDGQLAVVLAGARRGHAVLRVSAPTVREARRGWHRFLERYRDSGRAYVPVFKAVARRSGSRGGA
ncbi:MAG: hypothetical protein ACTHN3_05250 [Solirubrobacterales bacterium]